MIGMRFKLHFVGVPESLMTSVIIPGFEKNCHVTRMLKDEKKHDNAKSQAKALDKSKRAQAIGDVAAMNSTIERSQLHILSIK